MIFALGMVIARFVGEDLIGNTRNTNEFDRLFFVTVQMSCLVFAIAIPFFMIEPTSLPLSVGILAGLMGCLSHGSSGTGSAPSTHSRAQPCA